MATEKAETDRVPMTLALSTITYLEKLVRQGTHGTSVPGVAKTLIEEGIRLAIKDGLLVDPRQWQDAIKGAFGARRFGRQWAKGVARRLAAWDHHHARQPTHLDC